MSKAFCKSTNVLHPIYLSSSACLIISVRLIKAWEVEFFEHLIKENWDDKCNNLI